MQFTFPNSSWKKTKRDEKREREREKGEEERERW